MASHALVDRHTPALRKEHKKLIRGFSTVMSGLSDLSVSETDVLRVREILDPYLVPVRRYLVGGIGVSDATGDPSVPERPDEESEE